MSKNFRTPRTLADCEFTQGHPEVPSYAPITSVGHRVVFAVCLMVLVAWFGGWLQ